MRNQSGGSSTTEASQQRWKARPGIAFLLRAIVFLAPLAVSVLATQVVARSIERPDGLEAAWWWAMTVFIAIGVHLIATKAARRLAPAILLFKLSLVFPDAAPSRFSVALRRGTTRQLQNRLDQGKMSDLEPSEAAKYLLSVMSEINSHDRLTRGHSERVRAYSSLIADELHLCEEDANKLQWAALLHDIGKLSVPPEILNKAGKPTDEEWQILRTHPAAAVDLISPLKDWLGEWALAASQHHERWDGAGYPAGLVGEEIALAGRIVAVADAFDVMTATRSYKKALLPAVAKEELALCAGSQFDPKVVRAFLRAGLDETTARWAPLAWLGNLPGLAQIPAAASGAGTIVATSTVILAAAALQTPLAAAPPSQVDEVVYETTREDIIIPTTITIIQSIVDRETDEDGAGSSSTTSEVDHTTTTGSRRDVTTSTGIEDTTTTSDTAGTTTTSDTAGTTTTTSQSGTTTTTSKNTTTTSGSGSPTSTTNAPTTTSQTTSTTTTTAATSTTTTTSAPTTSTSPLSPPVAVNDSYSLDKKKDLKVLKNDSSGSSSFDKKSLTVISGPAHGSTKIKKGKVQYKPDKEYVGPDAFTYRICNKGGLCDTANVSITVIED
ncbi:MAG: HD domain-containing phosphohydrolase [Acidimicrobiales bacterium]